VPVSVDSRAILPKNEGMRARWVREEAATKWGSAQSGAGGVDGLYQCSCEAIITTGGQATSATRRPAGTGCSSRKAPEPIRFFLDTGMRPVSNACSGELGEVPHNKVNAHLGYFDLKSLLLLCAPFLRQQQLDPWKRDPHYEGYLR